MDYRGMIQEIVETFKDVRWSVGLAVALGVAFSGFSLYSTKASSRTTTST